jgi:hypothetical protein
MCGACKFEKCKHAEAKMLHQRQAVLNYSIITEVSSHFIVHQSFASYARLPWIRL